MASTNRPPSRSAASSLTSRLTPITLPYAETGIRGQRLAIGFGNRVCNRRAARVRVLDDRPTAGWSNSLNQFPTGVQVDQVVVAELLALQLPRTPRPRDRFDLDKAQLSGADFLRSGDR